LNQDKVDPSHTVKNFLEEKGYQIKDTDNYRKGLAHKHITTGDPDRGIPIRTKWQAYKIGSVLQQHQAPDHIVHAYTHDPIRASGGDNDYDIVIANHHHDVYGMSTNQGWTSCSDMNKPGVAAKNMKDEINNHTHVAYLVKRGEDYDKNAIARLAFKHHTAVTAESDIAKPLGTTSYKPKHQTLISEGKVYGQAPTDFQKVAEHEMSKLFPVKDDIYMKNTNVYNDNGKILHVPEGKQVSSESLDTAWKSVDKGSKHRLYEHVGLEGKYKAKKLRDVQNALKEITAEPTGNFEHDISRIRDSVYNLDSDQKRNGIEYNKNITQEKLQPHLDRVMQNFDVNNSNHLMELRLLNGSRWGGPTHPLRYGVMNGVEKRIPVVKTVADFDTANKLHKLLGNRDHQSLKVSDDHELGDDPVKHLANAGVLHDVNDFSKAYSSFRTGSRKTAHENWYSMAHRLNEEKVPNAHLALQDAIEKLKDRSTYRNNDAHEQHLATAYHYMSPNAKHYYASQLGHDPDALAEKHKDYLSQFE
jgi:hypothetical protein